MRIGLLLPGQGFQRAGILAEKLVEFPKIVTLLLQETDSVLPDLRLSRPLQDPNFNGDLTPTSIAQPLILAASYALYKTFETHGDVKMAMGHSLGEISALACANVLTFRDALMLVHQRGIAMTEAAKQETGMHVFLKPRRFKGDWAARLEEVAKEFGVSIANYNSPAQTVLSGASSDLQRVAQALRKDGSASQELKVSGAFHSPYMASAQPRLAELVAKLEMSEPKYPIISNKTAEPFGSVEEIRRSIPEMLVTPVKWHQSTSYAAQHLDKFVSLGPGRIGKMTAREYQIETEYYE